MTLLRDSLERLGVMRWHLDEGRSGSNKIDFSWCGERAESVEVRAVRAVVEGVKPPDVLVVYWCMSDEEFDKFPVVDGAGSEPAPPAPRFLRDGTPVEFLCDDGRYDLSAEHPLDVFPAGAVPAVAQLRLDL